MIIQRASLRALLIAGLYVVLFVYDSNLYPRLTSPHTAVLSLLRLGLLAAPLVLGFGIVKWKEKRLWRWAFLLAWILFLPYTIYSITEIRHVAELCRLPVSGTYYTGECVADAWKLLPTLIYAFAGTIGFVFTVHQVTSSLAWFAWKRRALVLALCVYSAFASVFGLYSRLNVWRVFRAPGSTARTVAETFGQDGFVLNVVLFALFIGVTIFVAEYFWSARKSVFPEEK